jgi:hypothetical protein
MGGPIKEGRTKKAGKLPAALVLRKNAQKVPVDWRCGQAGM